MSTTSALRERYSNRHPAVREIIGFFAYEHLPEPLRDVSGEVCELACWMIDNQEDSAELTAGLRKLLEAKDCFVRSALV